MRQYKGFHKKRNRSENETSEVSHFALNSFNLSKRIMIKYTISRKSANFPALIFLRLFGTRSVNKITNIKRIQSIYNYFNLNFRLYFKVISQLERRLGSRIETQKPYPPMIDYTFHEPYFGDTFLSLKNIQPELNTGRELFKTTFYYGAPSLAGLQRSVKGIEHKSLDSNRTIFLTRPHLAKETLPLESSPPRHKGMSSIAYKYSKFLNHTLLKPISDAQMLLSYTQALQKRTPFKASGEDFYYRDQQKIEKEVEEMKKIIIETKEEISKKTSSTPSLKDMDLKRYSNIDYLTDQVCQNIERRIRIEKERRGL